MIFWSRFSKITLLVILIIEILSLATYTNTYAHGIALFFILVSFIYITWKDTSFGLYALFSELIIGSQGYLLSASVGGFKISLRLSMFVLFFLIWLIKDLKISNIKRLITNKTIILFLAVTTFLVLGTIRGYLNNYDLFNIFTDVNGYLYLFLIVPIIDLIRNNKFNPSNSIPFLSAALVAHLTKVFFSVYTFSHNLGDLGVYLYKWIRDTRVGEITRVSMDLTFQRVFFQSQITSLFFITLLCILSLFLIRDKFNKYHFFIATGIFSNILISFSRSFWLGLIFIAISVVLYIIFEIINNHLNFKHIVKFVAYWIGIFLTSFALISALAYFPVPKPGSFDWEALSNRAKSSFSDEAAVSSRWKLLPPLLDKIKESPLIGSGFGTPVTYNSDDPRIKNELNPTGLYTTTTFEWGFLDTVTEIGILGLLVFLVFVLYVTKKIILLAIKKDWLSTGLLISLFSLLVVHNFTPYLNHPIGLGFLAFLVAIYTWSDLNSENHSQNQQLA